MLFDRDFLKHHRTGVRAGVGSGVANTMRLVLGEK